MVTKKAAKKTKTTSKATTKGKKQKTPKAKTGARVELYEKELTIKFDDPKQLLAKLVEATEQFAGAPTLAADVLGAARARLIVSQCAQSTAWGSTVGELGLNPLLFRNCVASGVDQAGFQPPNFPVGTDTRLIDVVIAIQGAPRK